MLIETVHAASNVVDITGGVLQKGKDGLVSPGLIVNGVLGLITSLAYPLAFLAILYSAYILISSVGKPEAFTTAKKNISFLLIGIFLIVFAAAFVRFITGIFS